MIITEVAPHAHSVSIPRRNKTGAINYGKAQCKRIIYFYLHLQIISIKAI